MLQAILGAQFKEIFRFLDENRLPEHLKGGIKPRKNCELGLKREELLEGRRKPNVHETQA